MKKVLPCVLPKGSRNGLGVGGMWDVRKRASMKKKDIKRRMAMSWKSLRSSET